MVSRMSGETTPVPLSVTLALTIVAASPWRWGVTSSVTDAWTLSPFIYRVESSATVYWNHDDSATVYWIGRR